jgi:uncharacterized small protein (DUF1192 family)
MRVQRELEEKIALLMNELEELKALVSRSMDTIGGQELHVKETKYFDAVADQLQSSCPPDREEYVFMILVVHDLEQEKVQHMEALVNQQFFAIKELEDLQAALEEELEAVTSCQEVDNSQLLKVSKDHEADLVKFCKDLGESSREQTLGSARI